MGKFMNKEIVEQKKKEQEKDALIVSLQTENTEIKAQNADIVLALVENNLM